MENIKSIRGSLIEIVVSNGIYSRVFDEMNVDKIKKSIQKDLNKMLKFKVDVSDFVIKDNFLIGQLFFKEDDKKDTKKRVVDVTIFSTNDKMDKSIHFVTK